MRYPCSEIAPLFRCCAANTRSGCPQHTLQLRNRLRQRTAALFARLIGRIAYRDYHHRIDTLGLRELHRKLRRIEIADPATPQTLFSSRQTDMFGSDCSIYIGMVMPVERPFPRNIPICQNHDADRCRRQPVATVTALKTLPRLTAPDNGEMPWLTVHGRRRQACTFEYVIEFRLLDLPVRVTPNRTGSSTSSLKFISLFRLI